jgi:protein phosphatase
VLCSDGLSNELRREQIEQVVSAHDDPQQAAEALVRAAVDAGGRDNVTVIVVALDDGDEDDGDVDTAPRNGAGSRA